jgi:UDP-2,4-diacetamido-2,4,6-trideoxy-beta-L-altropyranose hydrolase
VFRVDWSTDLGLGHVQRCLALMDAFNGRDFEAIFIARELRGTTPVVVESRGHAVAWMPASPNTAQRTEGDDAREFRAALAGRVPRLVVVDHYGLGCAWEADVMASGGAPIVAIDGRADREHVAAIVVDPTVTSAGRIRWQGLLGPDVALLEGPEFTLVAPRFGEALRRRPDRDGTISRILVSFGGSDPFGSTQLAIRVLQAPEAEGLQADIVIGATHPEPDRIRSLCESVPSLTFHHSTSRMAELITRADLAIGAGGVSAFERTFLGCPALVVIAAENQREQVMSLAASGAIEALGDASDLTEERLRDRLAARRQDPAGLREMSSAARAVMGHAQRPGSVLVAEEVMALLR